MSEESFSSSIFSRSSSASRSKSQFKPREMSAHITNSNHQIRLDESGDIACSGIPTDGGNMPMLLSRPDLDPVQRARHVESQRSRLILGARSSSPRTESPSLPMFSLQRNKTMHHPPATTARREQGKENETHLLSNIQRISNPDRVESDRPKKSLEELYVRSDDRLGEGLTERTSNRLGQQFSDVEPTHQLRNLSGVAPLGPSEVVSLHGLAPPAYSRSASVVSSVIGRHDDDISAIMMRGASDLRNAKFEVEEQRREISFLQSQITALKDEKKEALARLKAVKDATKRSLEKSSQTMTGLETVMKELKAQSETSFDVVAQARSSLPELQALRVTVAEAMNNIEPLLDENGQFAKGSDAKAIIAELELDCDKSHQVADMLRERLQSVGSELVDAKSRIMELEENQAVDRKALLASTSSLTDTGNQYTELANAMKKQQSELYDILSTAAETESQVLVFKEQIGRLEAAITEKDAELAMLRELRLSNASLTRKIEEQDTTITSLQSTAQELNVLRAQLHDKELTIRALEVTVSAKDDNLTELKTRIDELDTHLQQANAQAQQMREDLQAYRIREDTAHEHEKQHTTEIATLRQSIEVLESSVKEEKKHSDSLNENLRDANRRYQALEERFEDQSVTLRITRESNGDLQERLVASEATFARDLEAATGKFTCQIAVLKEQNASLHSKIDYLELQTRRLEGDTATLKGDYETKLGDQQQSHQALLDSERKRADRTESELQSSRVLVQSLHDQLSSLTTEMQNVREQLDVAKMPSPAHIEEISSLKVEVKTLETDNCRLSERARTIESRYRNGDLSEEEKAFVNNLVQTSKAIHEKELIAKGNELRRRDNVVKELRAKNHLLEATLSKHLQSQAKPKVVPASANTAMAENKSMINPASWMSSDMSSSPAAPGSQAPDRDAPSTNEDNTVTAKPTPAPSRPAGRLKPTLPVALAQATPEQEISTAVPNAATPSVPKTPSNPVLPEPMRGTARAKPVFGRLARDSSDEILDFDDMPTSRLPLATILGKRDKMSSPLTNAEGMNAPRPAKRSRATSHKVNEQEVISDLPDKPTNQVAPKSTKSRRRR